MLLQFWIWPRQIPQHNKRPKYGPWRSDDNIYKSNKHNVMYDKQMYQITTITRLYGIGQSHPIYLLLVSQSPN